MSSREDIAAIQVRIAKAQSKESSMRQCEIIYVQDPKGWKWRAISAKNSPKRETSAETFQLFYECVLAARAKGYVADLKRPVHE